MDCLYSCYLSSLRNVVSINKLHSCWLFNVTKQGSMPKSASNWLINLSWQLLARRFWISNGNFKTTRSSDSLFSFEPWSTCLDSVVINDFCTMFCDFHQIKKRKTSAKSFLLLFRHALGILSVVAVFFWLIFICESTEIICLSRGFLAGTTAVTTGFLCQLCWK